MPRSDINEGMVDGGGQLNRLPGTTTEPTKTRLSILSTIARILERSWRPESILLPTIDPYLTQLSFIERSAEVLRFQLLRLEYALSPEGWLREYLKLNLRIAACVAIPASILGPVIAFVLIMVVGWTASLLTIAVNCLLTLLAVIAIAALLTGVLFIVRQSSS